MLFALVSLSAFVYAASTQAAEYHYKALWDCFGIALRYHIMKSRMRFAIEFLQLLLLGQW